jgi:hypothetical protein
VDLGHPRIGCFVERAGDEHRADICLGHLELKLEQPASQGSVLILFEGSQGLPVGERRGRGF